MARRIGRPLWDAQYCADTKRWMVHDLDEERSSCEIDEIVRAGQARPFMRLAAAEAAGFTACPKCIGGSIGGSRDRRPQ